MLKQLPLLHNICGLIIGVLFLVMISVVVATAAAFVQYDDISIQTMRTDLLPTAVQTTPVHPSPSSVPFPTEEEVQPYYAEKVVYLTFDDGPEPINTSLILDILKQHAVPATFFVVGTQVEAYPDLLKRMHTEGHAIGNHSYNHRYNELYHSPDTYIGQLQKCDAIIEAALGIKPRISRAPGGTTGSFTSEYWAALKREGYKDIGWNICSGDASSAKSTQITSNVIAQARKNKFLWSHAIVLMHDGRGHTETSAALPEIIAYFKKEGFEFRRVDGSTPPAW